MVITDRNRTCDRTVKDGAWSHGRVEQWNKNMFTYFYEQTEEALADIPVATTKISETNFHIFSI